MQHREHAPKEVSLKYLFQNYPGRSVEEFDRLPADERQAIVEEYLAIRRLPGVVGGGQLGPIETATTVRVKDGSTLVTDGPFVELKEAVGGYCFFEADDLDAAIALAARIPAASMGGAIEVRPLMER
jgi:hypothetical protein